MKASPTVDVVIAVHDPARPIERAVASVLDHTEASVRVTVVCHGIAAAPIVDRLAAWNEVRVVEHVDGIRSPAGPYNAGLDLVEAPWFSVLGSDDELDPGAIDSWLRTADRAQAQVVIAALRLEGHPSVLTPPVRPFRRRRLDAVRDRLAYRTAPLGLISTTAFPTLRFTEGVTTGEDLEFSTHLWFGGASIAFDARGPGYRGHLDFDVRVTTSLRPVADDFAALTRLITGGEFDELSADARSALSVKLMRVAVVSAIANRPSPPDWRPEDVAELTRFCELLRAWSPDFRRSLSRTDEAIVDAILSGGPPETLVGLVRRRQAYRSPGVVMTRRLRDTFRRDSPLRWIFASLLVQRVQGRHSR